MALAELETSLRECLPVVDEAIQCQLRKTRSTRDKRLARIERDLELAPAAIPRTFGMATAPRAEPVGAIVLLPLEPCWGLAEALLNPCRGIPSAA